MIATSMIIIMTSAAFVVERGVELSGFYISSFYILIFYLLGSSMYFTLKKELSEDYLVRDNIFLWFVTGFIGSRFIVAAAGTGTPDVATGAILFLPFSEIWLEGYHLHHYMWGLGMIAVSNILMLEEVDVYRPRVAALFGLGMGILFDEIGLLLSLNNYSESITYPIVAVIAVLLYVNAERDLLRKFI